MYIYSHIIWNTQVYAYIKIHCICMCVCVCGCGCVYTHSSILIVGNDPLGGQFEFKFPPPHPSLKELSPQGGIPYD